MICRKCGVTIDVDKDVANQGFDMVLHKLRAEAIACMLQNAALQLGEIFVQEMSRGSDLGR